MSIKTRPSSTCDVVFNIMFVDRKLHNIYLLLIAMYMLILLLYINQGTKISEVITTTLVSAYPYHVTVLYK